MAMWVICDAAMPAWMSCRCMPSPGSTRIPSSSQRMKNALCPRSRVGTWLEVPRKTTSRVDMATGGRRSDAHRLHLLPPRLRQRPRLLPGLDGPGRGRVTLQRPRHHPLEDAGEAEQVVGHVEAPVRGIDGAHAHALAVEIAIRLLGGDALA